MTDSSLDDELAERRRKEVEDMKWLMAHKPGRRFMWRLLELAGVYRTSFNNSGSVTAFNEGQRNVGLRYVAEIQELTPDHYLLMLKERNE
jgi:hypothetical protein